MKIRWLGVLVFAVLVLVHRPASAQVTLIPLGSTWKYLDNGTDQGTAWRGVGFDDSTWASGAAELGYGDGDEATVVGFVDVGTASGVQKNATTYFRRTFSIANPGVFSALSLSVEYDDAAAVYVNGTEVTRTANLAAGAAYNVYATGAAIEDTIQTWTIPTSVLVSGTNTIAVEIHQQASSSSDISFNLSLTGITSASVTRGPYLQKAATDAVTVRWRTDLATDSRVRFGLSQGTLNLQADDAAVTTEHEVRLTGLSANTTYFYSVGTTTVEVASGADFRFTTPPVPGTVQPVRVWVIGDSGTADANAAAVRTAYTNFTGTQHTDVWLMLGDNAYNNGTDAEFQSAVFNMYPVLLRNTFLWPTIGNHETPTQGSSSGEVTVGGYLDIFSLPTNGEGGGLASGTEKYYSFDYGNVHFICLDSMTSNRTASGPMATWLANDLATTTRTWIVAYWHHPPYTKGSHNSDTETGLVEMRSIFLPILEAGGVDLVLGGHSHSYERSMLIDGHYGVSTTLTEAMKKDAGDGKESGGGAYGKDPVAHGGAVYSVCGSSGQISGGSLNHPVMISSLNVLGSLVLDVNGPRMDARFIDSTGVVRDNFTILKSPLVTVSATPSAISEDSAQPAVVTLSRTRDIASPLSVSLTLGGTAAMGSDYANVTLPVTIPGGQASASFDITPLRDELAEGSETVIATAQSGSDYRVHRDSKSATVTVADSANANWRVLQFGANANTLSISGDEADPDGDGIPNLQERAFGLDPLVASQTDLPSIVSGPYLTLSFRRPAGVEDLLYTVQVSGDLAPLGWNDGSSYQGAGSIPSNAYTTEVSRSGSDPEVIVVRDNIAPGAGQSRFMRVKVARP